MVQSSTNNSFTLLDYILGRTGVRQGPTDNLGFLFIETSGRTNSGERVNVETALEEATVSTCVNVIREGLSQIPYCIKKQNTDGGFDLLTDHPISLLLNKPNVFQSPTDFKSSIISTLLIHGNCFIRVIRAQDGPAGPATVGRPVQLVPMDPVDVTTGVNEFGIPNYHHESFGDMAAENVIHIKDLSIFTANGYSRVLLASELVGIKLGLDKAIAFGLRDGFDAGAVVTTDQSLTPDEIKAYTDSINEAFGSQGDKKKGVMMLGGGANLTQLKGVTPADMDLRELRDDVKAEIAAVFKVPGFMVGAEGGQQYNNVRAKQSSFHRDTLQPIITNIEEAITMKLIDAADESVHFKIEDYIKGDINAQTDVVTRNVQAGIMTPNEARDYLGMKRHDGPTADELIEPNSTSSETNNVTENTTTTGGSDGPRSGESDEDGEGPNER